MTEPRPASSRPDPADLSQLPPPPLPADCTASPADPSLADSSLADDTSAPAGAEPEWWQAEGMPWRHKPTRADKWCMAWIAFMGLFGLAMLPLRGWLLGLDPPLLLGLTGSRTGAAATGALASQGLAPDWWPWALVAGSLMSIKFDWAFWWAGKLWGRGMIEVWSGKSPRAAKSYARAERWAHKLGWVGMFVAYVPIPLPLMQVIFVLFGASGMSWKRFLALDFLASTVWLLAYFWLGWMIGEPAVAALKTYAKFANYVAIALVVLVAFSIYRNGAKQAKSKS